MMKNKTKNIAGTLLIAGALLLGGCTNEQQPEEVTDSKEWSANFLDEMLSPEANIQDTYAKLKANISQLDEDSAASSIEAYMYLLEVDAQRFNAILPYIMQDVEKAQNDIEGIDFVKGENLDKLKPGIVKGFVEQTKDLQLQFIQRDEDGFEVVVNFDDIKEDFGQYINEELEQKIALSKHIQEKPDYLENEGTLDFEAIWSRLELIDSFKSKEGELPRMMQEQEYFYTQTLYGFADPTMNEQSGGLNEYALEEMLRVAQEHKNDPRAESMVKIVAKAREEGTYGDDTMEFASELLNEQFKEFIDQLMKEREEAEKAEELENTPETPKEEEEIEKN